MHGCCGSVFTTSLEENSCVKGDTGLFIIVPVSKWNLFTFPESNESDWFYWCLLYNRASNSGAWEEEGVAWI